jgi:hypothetical protein
MVIFYLGLELVH